VLSIFRYCNEERRFNYSSKGHELSSKPLKEKGTYKYFNLFQFDIFAFIVEDESVNLYI